MAVFRLKLFGWPTIGIQRRNQGYKWCCRVRILIQDGVSETPIFQSHHLSNEEAEGQNNLLKVTQIISYSDTVIELEVHIHSVFFSLALNNGNEMHNLRKLVPGPREAKLFFWQSLNTSSPLWTPSHARNRKRKCITHLYLYITQVQYISKFLEMNSTPIWDNAVLCLCCYTVCLAQEN